MLIGGIIMPNVNTNTYEYQERQKCKDNMEKILSGLPDYVSRFLNHKLNGSRHLQPRTVLAYAGDLNLFFYYLSISNPLCKNINIRDISAEEILANLTIDDIEDYYEWLSSYERNGKAYENGQAAKKRKIAAVSSMYKYLLKNHYVSSNPCELMEYGRIEDAPIITLTKNEQSLFLNELYSPEKSNQLTNRSKKIKEHYTSLRDIAIAYLFFGTGMRVSELVAININDINAFEKYVYIKRKGGKTQKLFFNDEVADVLINYLDASRPKMLPEETSRDYEALFLSLHRKRLCVRQVENVIKSTAERALGDTRAAKISCHKLRSTYGTRLLKASGNIALVAEVLGHKDISTTKRRYAAIQGLEEAPNYVSIL